MAISQASFVGLVLLVLNSLATALGPLSIVHDFTQPTVYSNLTFDEFQSLYTQYQQWQHENAKSVNKREYTLTDLDEICQGIGPDYRFQSGWCGRNPERRKWGCKIPGRPTTAIERNRLGRTQTCASGVCKVRPFTNAEGNVVQFPYCATKVEIDKPEGAHEYEGEYDWVNEPKSPGERSFFVEAGASMNLDYDFVHNTFHASGQGHTFSCILCPIGWGAKLTMTHPNSISWAFVSTIGN
ncbi:hypothetical protein CORC01_14225 [Colletotrichum orchidophilum]|uniref:Secreted in xylem 1 n=1 Tax=Colletotrichum orchidophilum TaxID=1209926 RepID=A0A1G4AMT1_9PEZI|nr:uncharacterized protein CORC01_14225 [Colletotrichum orchidophilum]OHE90474.1 hypothetical protein CORC01_14225 [Colletotrichum orchidophilum]